MGEGGDIVIGEELGQAIPAVHRQDGRERIQLQRAPGLRVRGDQAVAVGRAHRAPPSRLRSGRCCFRTVRRLWRCGTRRQAPRRTAGEGTPTSVRDSLAPRRRASQAGHPARFRSVRLAIDKPPFTVATKVGWYGCQFVFPDGAIAGEEKPIQVYSGAVRPELPDAHHTWGLAAEGPRRKECFTERRPHSPGCRYPAARRSNPTCRAPGTMG